MNWVTISKKKSLDLLNLNYPLPILEGLQLRVRSDDLRLNYSEKVK